MSRSVKKALTVAITMPHAQTQLEVTAVRVWMDSLETESNVKVRTHHYEVVKVGSVIKNCCVVHFRFCFSKVSHLYEYLTSLFMLNSVLLYISHRHTKLHHKYYDVTQPHFRSSQKNSIHLLLAEILCTEKNSRSKLCRQVESMRQQLEEIPHLRKMLREQSSLLEKTNKNVIAISRSLQDVRDSQPKQVILRQN